MKFRLILLMVVLLVLPTFGAPLEEQSASGNSSRYLVLNTVKANTLQKELDEVAALGYHLIFGDASHHILILEKTTEKYQYRVVEGMKENFKAAIAEGYSAVAETFSNDPNPFKSRALIMEKAANDNVVHDYALLFTVRSKTLQKELNERAAKGYELAGISNYAANNAVMEKRSADAPAIPNRYLLLATSRTSTMQKELNEAVGKGYKVVAGSGGDEIKIVLEKTATTPEYRLLATGRSSTLEREINDAVAAGFRPLPRTLLALNHSNSMFGGFTLTPYETVIIMEKAAAPEPFTYKIIGTNRVGTFKNELAQAASEGFELIGFTLTYQEQVGLMRRAEAAPMHQNAIPNMETVNQEHVKQ